MLRISHVLMCCRWSPGSLEKSLYDGKKRDDDSSDILNIKDKWPVLKLFAPTAPPAQRGALPGLHRQLQLGVLSDHPAVPLVPLGEVLGIAGLYSLGDSSCPCAHQLMPGSLSCSGSSPSLAAWMERFAGGSRLLLLVGCVRK